MKGLRKRVVALAIVTAMAMTSFVGCASNELDNSEVVATVNGEKITVGVVNFYMRYQQAMLEDSYGSMTDQDIWSMVVTSGTTYADEVKANWFETIQQLYILKGHMDDYDVEITDEDKEAIEKAVKEFDKANGETEKSLISGDKKTVKEVLTLLTIGDKMGDAMVADVDTEVSDDEAAQKAMSYVYFTTQVTDDTGSAKDMSKDEIKEVKKEATSFLAKAKQVGDLEACASEEGQEASTLTFDEESTNLDEEIMEVANALEKGEFSEVIEADDGFYVLQLTSELDADATNAKKETIVQERKDAKYQSIYTPWYEEAKIKVNDDVLAKIVIPDIDISIKHNEETTEE